MIIYVINLLKDSEISVIYNCISKINQVNKIFNDTESSKSKNDFSPLQTKMCALEKKFGLTPKLAI